MAVLSKHGGIQFQMDLERPSTHAEADRKRAEESPIKMTYIDKTRKSYAICADGTIVQRNCLHYERPAGLTGGYPYGWAQATWTILLPKNQGKRVIKQAEYANVEALKARMIEDALGVNCKLNRWELSGSPRLVAAIKEAYNA